MEMGWKSDHGSDLDQIQNDRQPQNFKSEKHSNPFSYLSKILNWSWEYQNYSVLNEDNTFYFIDINLMKMTSSEILIYIENDSYSQR